MTGSAIQVLDYNLVVFKQGDTKYRSLYRILCYDWSEFAIYCYAGLEDFHSFHVNLF